MPATTPTTPLSSTKRARRRNKGPVPEHLHGSIGAYANYGCHCTPCREAHNAYQRKYKARKLGASGSASRRYLLALRRLRKADTLARAKAAEAQHVESLTAALDRVA